MIKFPSMCSLCYNLKRKNAGNDLTDPIRYIEEKSSLHMYLPFPTQLHTTYLTPCQGVKYRLNGVFTVSNILHRKMPYSRTHKI
jgi:hypothetical protein